MTRRTVRSGDRSIKALAIGIIAAVLLVVFVVLPLIASRATEKTVTFTVTRVGDRVTTSCSGTGRDRDCHTKRELLVYTDHGTYKDTDSVWFFKFNSADLIGQLQDGHTYRCKTTGFRLGFTSSYRNLISCAEVPR